MKTVHLKQVNELFCRYDKKHHCAESIASLAVAYCDINPRKTEAVVSEQDAWKKLIDDYVNGVRVEWDGRDENKLSMAYTYEPDFAYRVPTGNGKSLIMIGAVTVIKIHFLGKSTALKDRQSLATALKTWKKIVEIDIVKNETKIGKDVCKAGWYPVGITRYLQDVIFPSLKHSVIFRKTLLSAAAKLHRSASQSNQVAGEGALVNASILESFEGVWGTSILNKATLTAIKPYTDKVTGQQLNKHTVQGWGDQNLTWEALKQKLIAQSPLVGMLIKIINDEKYMSHVLDSIVIEMVRHHICFIF